MECVRRFSTSGWPSLEKWGPRDYKPGVSRPHADIRRIDSVVVRLRRRDLDGLRRRCRQTENPVLRWMAAGGADAKEAKCAAELLNIGCFGRLAAPYWGPAISTRWVQVRLSDLRGRSETEIRRRTLTRVAGACPTRAWPDISGANNYVPVRRSTQALPRTRARACPIRVRPTAPGTRPCVTASRSTRVIQRTRACPIRVRPTAPGTRPCVTASRSTRVIQRTRACPTRVRPTAPGTRPCVTAL